jgi:hypothetical protein
VIRVVVGGQSRNVGKTQAACEILSATRERGWTAVKITRFGHGLCSADGKPCDCAVENPSHPFALSWETDAAGRSDTSRMLAAGAVGALWLRAPQDRLAEAMPRLEARLAGAGAVLLESNSALDFFEPDVYVAVLDFRVEDFKPSARRAIERADVFVVSSPPGVEPPWGWFDAALLERRPVFGPSDPAMPRFVAKALERRAGGLYAVR